MCDYDDMPTYLLGESRYEPNGTPTAAQHCGRTLKLVQLQILG